MNFKEHREISRQTWHKEDVEHKQRLLHAVLGLIDETGEISSCLKKEIGYGKPIDLVNMKEELGDKIYFLQRVLDECEFTPKGKNEHICLDNLISETNPFIRTPFESICQLSYDTSVVAVQISNRMSSPEISRMKILINRFEIVRVLTQLIQLINFYGFTISEVLESNISKLEVRYGKELEFTQDKAINRDLHKEKIALTK